MLTEHPELPNGALKSVDALVTKSDGAHFLLAAVHFMLNVRPAQNPPEAKADVLSPRIIRKLTSSHAIFLFRRKQNSKEQD